MADLAILHLDSRNSLHAILRSLFDTGKFFVDVFLNFLDDVFISNFQKMLESFLGFKPFNDRFSFLRLKIQNKLSTINFIKRPEIRLNSKIGNSDGERWIESPASLARADDIDK